MPIVVLIISVTTMSLLHPLLTIQLEKEILLILPSRRSSRDLDPDLLMPTRIIILAGNGNSCSSSYSNILLPSIPLPPLCLLSIITATETTDKEDATP